MKEERGSKGIWNEGSSPKKGWKTRSKGMTCFIFTQYWNRKELCLKDGFIFMQTWNSKVNFGWESLFHFFNDLDIERELGSEMVSFLCNLETKSKLCLRKPIPFFNELDMERELCSRMV